jgi:hypothetical protein
MERSAQFRSGRWLGPKLVGLARADPPSQIRAEIPKRICQMYAGYGSTNSKAAGHAKTDGFAFSHTM